VSHSTPEAEIIAADHAVRAEGIPALSLLETTFERKVHLRMMEDNEAMVKICHSGKNPTMRYPNRTHKVGVSWLMEVFHVPECDVYKIDAKLQAADIGTKRITCVDTWRSICVLINLCEPDVDATAQRALLSTLRNDTVEKLALRKEFRRAKALGRLAVNSGSTACLPGGGSKLKFAKKTRVPTNNVIYDDPSTHACMCCGDWDTDCEAEYPCETVINHCATCSHPWDATCESDSSDGRNDDENNDTSFCCLPCESVGRQWCV
jgi:hypothetical protein